MCKRGLGSLELKLQGAVGSLRHYGNWEPSSGPLEEEQVLMRAEPPL